MAVYQVIVDFPFDEAAMGGGMSTFPDRTAALTAFDAIRVTPSPARRRVSMHRCTHGDRVVFDCTTTEYQVVGG